MVYVGGKNKHSLIELHDIMFVVGESIEDTYEQLRASWWGIPESLHVDAWGKISYVDGYRLDLQGEPPSHQTMHVYFVNLGGYDSHQFTELHQYLCVIAASPEDAEKKAKSQMANWESPHKDYLFDIDDCINISNLLTEKGVFIHLTKTEKQKPFEFTCAYVPLHQDEIVHS